MTNLASATRTQVTGKAWISRKNLLTQRVLYEVTLKNFRMSTRRSHMSWN